MKFVEKYTKLFALLGVLSVSVWGMGCANSESTTKEAGSTTSSETKAASGDKAESGDKAASGDKAEAKADDKKTDEKKADDKN